ncbi:MAG: diacylglycerol kinase family protein [Oscillospiraceae bacterium]
MKHLFIINPAAGSHDRTEEYSKVIHQLCREKGLDYEIQVSTAPGEATRIAREAAQSGEEVRLYACGGDGTLQEVAAGAAGYDNAAVTVFSGGSGNDFVKLFDDPKAFFHLERLLDPEEVTFDMIRCNDDLALNICSVGLDARIAADVSRYKRIPLLQGFRAYLVSTAVNLMKGISEPYTVEVNGEQFDGERTFVCVCNGRYYGGGFNPIPEADPTDGMLDVLLVDKVSLLQVPGLIGKYKDGLYQQISHVARYVKTNCVKVFSEKPTAVNLDGETRVAREVVMKLAEEKLRFFYPRGLTWQTNAKCKMQNAEC